ncbi:unnamed protein product [Discosporangium mesarthrocarpum]
MNEATGCKALRKFTGHESSVEAVLHVGPSLAVSCSNDRTLRTWDHRVKGSVGVLRGHTGPVTCAQKMKTERNILASGSADGTVMMWDVRSTARGPTRKLRGHGDRVTCMVGGPDSLYSCSEDSCMLEWDWISGDLPRFRFGGRGGRGGAGGGGISCVARTGRALLTAGWDHTVRMWPLSSPDPLPGDHSPGDRNSWQ